MTKYMKFIKTMLIIDAVVLAILIVVLVQKSLVKKEVVPRTNSECTNTERVFDYADKMTDQEERELRERIAKTEPLIQADIVVVTLEEPMSDSEVMDYSDDFQDSEKFGYNEPYGNCAMLVDNWDPSNTYMWFHTAGNIYAAYGNGEIQDLIDEVCAEVGDSPYTGYTTFVNSVYQTMTGDIVNDFWSLFLLSALIIVVFVIIFLLLNLYHHGSGKTTQATTYMRNHSSRMIQNEDVFLSKHTTSVRIQSDSGGSGGGFGGGHTSGGGHSYGGGGGHH